MSGIDRRLFQDRYEAGRRLATALAEYASRPNLLVLALPRGGVPIGHEVALALHAPLDIMLVRKLGVPGQEEMAMGAIASGGILVVEEEVVAAFRISPRVIDTAAARAAEEIERQERRYRGNLPHPPIAGRTIILVDDGLATGSSMRAAAAALGTRQPEHLAIAVPVAPAEVCAELRREVDKMVCLLSPHPFVSVGSWYRDFSQVDDEEVQELLRVPSAAGQGWR